jgi:predicted lipoprotein with Yx(FWY)xxD motif
MHPARSNKTRITLLAVTALTALAAIASACGGDDDADAPTVPAGAATAAATKAATSPAPTTGTASGITPVATAKADVSPEATAAATKAAATVSPGGEATVSLGAAGLVDSLGLSLYVFANDTADSGVSACGSGCLAVWPALTALAPLTAGPGVTGVLATITRDDGTTQVTYDGLPLYYFVNDKAAGDTLGKDIPNWSLAQP